MLVLVSVVIYSPPLRLRQGTRHATVVPPPSRSDRHLKASVHSLGIRPHVPEPMAPGLAVFRQPYPIVGDRQPQLLAVAVDTNDHPASTRVTDHVGQGVVGNGEKQTLVNDGQGRLPALLHQFR